MSVPKPSAPPKASDLKKDAIENGDGQQQDDNIDDLGRDLNHPEKKPKEQPTRQDRR